MVRVEESQFASTRPAPGGVSINWSRNITTEVDSLGLVTFTSVETGVQRAIEVAHSIPRCFPLLAGTYRVALVAPGCAPFRALVKVAPGEVASLNPVLNEDAAPPATLHDVLVGLDAPIPNVKPRDLEVPAGTTVVLNSDLEPGSRDWQMLTIRDVRSAKRIIGIADDTWGVDVPRFATTVHNEQLSPRTLAGQMAKEYIYGSASSVDQWEDLINTQMFAEPWVFPLFIYGVVTIYAGGVLRIGDGSNFFVCEELRMHITAKLEITGTGPGVVHPLSYRSFC